MHVRRSAVLALLALAVAPATGHASTGGAVATGASGGAGALRLHWTLAGRRLTITRTAHERARFGVRLRPGAEVSVACGDDTSYLSGVFGPGEQWAAVVSARARVAATGRTVRAVFAHDLARRTNQCRLVGSVGSAHAAMHLRRGRAPGCSPGGPERVVARDHGVLVMRTRVDNGDLGRDDVYRACRPGRRPRTILTGGISSGGGSTNGETGLRLLRIAGDRIGWADIRIEDGYGGAQPATISTVDLAGPARRPATFYASPDGWGAVVELVLARDGTVAWTVDETAPPTAPPDHDQRSLLLVDRTSSPTRLLDVAPAASAFADLRLSTAGDLVTYTKDGTPVTRPTT